MFNKKLMILTIFFVSLFVVSAVSAADNVTEDIIVDLASEDLISVDLENDESLNVNEDNSSNVLGATYMANNFDDIQNYIDTANEGDTIVLNGMYEMGSSDTIVVNKKLNFRGINDATIKGSSDKRLVTIKVNGVTFTGITFKNGQSMGHGAAIYSENFKLSYGNYMFSADNCKFIDNIASSSGSGGALYGGSAVNCIFVGNSATGFGGALFGGSAVNCIFVGNSAGYDGGALSGGSAENCHFENNSAGSGGALYGGSAVNCNFTSNSAGSGGAIFKLDGTATNCIFVGNSATRYGGAMYEGSAVNCNFSGNSAGSGGALYGGSAENCHFENNSAGSGGALYGGSAVNCNFTSNSAGSGGALYGGFVVNCSFVGNSASGDGGAMTESKILNCSFVGNSASGDGGALYNCNVANSLFENNSARGSGGAMMGMRATNSTFFNNHANNYGGAVYNASVSSNSIFINNSANIGNDYYGCTFFILDKTFTDLNFLIKNNLEIFLNDNYTFDLIFDSDFVNGITINHDVTIYGNGHRIDGSNQARMFTVTAGKVVFKDIIFVNGKSSDNGGSISGSVSVVNCSFVGNSAGSGGAMYGGSAVNCTFINNTASGGGGAIYGGFVVNCSFVGNSAMSNGGAVYFNNGGFVVNCSFVGNSVNSLYGGAVYFYNGGFVVNCSFVGNSVNGLYGGAVYIHNGGSVVNCSFVGNSADNGGALSGGSAVNCSFVGNSASSHGGALYGGSAENCHFENNSAVYGGAVYSSGAAVVGCSFVGNSAYEGGAIRFRSGSGSVVNCSFVNCSVGSNGGAIRFESDSVYVVNCSFVNCSARGNGGAISSFGFVSVLNCSFVNCSVGGNGGALHGVSAVNCTFISNSAINGYGGAMFEESALNSIFKDNSASSGGAIFNGYAINSLFEHNFAHVNGGAMSGVKAKNCKFLSNHANSYGGAVYNAKVSIDSIFSNNIANVGHDTYNVSFFTNEHTFSELYSLINNSENSDFYLNSNYAYDFASDSEFVEGIIINRDITIYGNGFTIDGSNQARMFTVTAGKVVFKDMIFINGKSSGNGGSISGSVSVVNCSFVGNSASSHGGALYGGSAVNCTFINNTASGGGALYGSSCSAVNCIFVGNRAGSGGALYFYGGSVVNCLFENNSADNYGGAVYFYSYDSEGSTVNCIFVGNRAGSGGAVYFYSYDSEGSTVNCSFVGNSASDYGGAICSRSVSVSFVNCTFINNTARAGGALSGGRAVNCSFTNNKGGYSSGSYFYDCIFDIYPNANCYYTSYLDVDDLIINKGEDGFLIVRLYDMRSPLSDKCINFTIGNYTVSDFTDSDGFVYLNVANYLTESGFHDVDVTFYGDKFIIPSSKTAKVFIKYDPEFSFENISITPGDDANLSVVLSNVYGQISGENIVFLINGQSSSKRTNINGLASLNINDYLTEIGEYTVRMVYSGNDFTNPGSANATVRINHYIGNLTVNVTGKYYNDTVLTFNLINSKNNNPVSDATINVTFSNGETMTLKTDSNGVACYTVPFNPGTYGLTAKVMGENIDVNEVTLNNIKINEIVGVIELSQNGTGYNSSNLIIRTYNNMNDDIYRKIKVHLEFNNGRGYDVVTDGEGIGIFHIPFDVGNYDVLAYATGSYISFNQPELNNILIEKSDSIVNGNDIEFTFGESGSTTLELIGCEGLESYSVIGHSEAQISFDGSNITVSGLTVGKYNLTIVTIPDYNHNPVTKNIEIAVNKALSDVKGNAIEFDYGSSCTTTLTVVGGSIANVSVVNAEANVSFEGNTVSVSGLDAGNYKLQVTTAPDEFHNPVTAFINITVNKIDSSVSGEGIVFDYNSSGSTIVTVVGGDISEVSVADHPEITPILSGDVVTVSGLDAGTYYLQVTTSPDKNHNSITYKNIKIRVNKIDSSVSGNEIIFDYGSTGTTTLTLAGASIKPADVTVVGYKANITLEGNKVYVSGLDYGNYTLKIISTPDSNHKSVTGYINITVNKAKADIGFSNTITFSSDSSGTTHVTYITGGDIDLSTISVIGHSQAGISYDKYTGVIRVSNLPVGSHTLMVTVIPDSNHEFVTKTLGITVTDSGSGGGKMDSKIDLENIVFTYGGSGSTIMTVVGGTVESSGISVDDHPEVKPKLEGNKIVVSGLNPGVYTLRVKTTPFSNYYSVTETVSITVNKVSSQIKASKARVVYKKSTKWTVKFTDSNGNPISGVKVTFKVYTGKKYETQSVATNSKGEASYNTKKLSKGTHKVIASIDHVGYSANPVTSSIKVIKQKALKFKVKKSIRKDGSALSITVKYKNKGINGVKLKLMVYDGKKLVKTVTLKTKTKGKFKGVTGWGTNKLKAGNHKIVIMPASITYSGSKSLKMKIKPSAKKYPKWETKI